MRRLTDNEIRKKGIEILSKEFGPVEMARFLQQFDTGRGNYTSERHKWLSHLSVESIVKDIIKKQKKK